MYQRINVTLPEETVKLIDRISKKGGRSRLIDKAVRHFVDSMGRTNLRKKLEEGGSARADRDLQVAKEWFSPADSK